MNDFLPFIVIGLVSGSVYGLAAVGLVLTYRTSGIFNFAHGGVAAVGAYLFYEVRDLAGLPSWLAFVVAVFVAGPLIGLLLELLARKIANGSVVSRVVATLGILVAIQQIIGIRYGFEALQFAPFLPTDTFEFGGVFVEGGQVITVVIALAGTVGLSLLLRFTRLGLAMRGVVDNTELLALTGTSPASVRRLAWMIGSVFASLSGVLIAPTLGLDALILTLLVVQAFGAAAIGRFTSLPLTYVGGLAIGIGAALATKYVGQVDFVDLNGLPSSLPFLVLFAVLVLVPKSKLVDIAADRRPPLRRSVPLPPAAQVGLAIAGVAVLALLPEFVGIRLLVYTQGLAIALVFLSLVLLERQSGQLSLAQLAFAAVGGTTFARAIDAGLPFFVALLVTAAVAVPVGALLAIPAIRLSGLYLALATLGFSLVMERLIYGTDLMFGSGTDTIDVPRPSFADTERSYYYLVLGVVVAVCLLVTGVRRARLGRLLRSMADSPTALATHGMNVTVLKVIVYCLAAAIAAVGGALSGPVTGQLSSESFTTFASLLLIVTLTVVGLTLSDVPAAFASGFSLVVIPSYIAGYAVNEYLPVVFGVSAVGVAIYQSTHVEGGKSHADDDDGDEQLTDRARRSPARARLTQRQEVPA